MRVSLKFRNPLHFLKGTKVERRSSGKWFFPFFNANKQQTNSVALVREGTVPTERPQLFGEVSANFCG
jgi:hypothetical protein